MSERVNDWYAASLVEVHALVEELAEGDVTLSAEDDVVAALLSMLSAGVVVSRAAAYAASTVQALQLLEV